MPPKPTTKSPLTRLEAEVMNAVWDAEPRPVRARDVLDALNENRRRKLAYTTVQTMLTILKDKGFVAASDAEGRAHIFRAKVSRAAASRHLVGDVVDRLFGGRVQPLLQMLVEDERLDAAELKQLREWVESRLRNEGTGGRNKP